jgi:hypothetical protein
MSDQPAPKRQHGCLFYGCLAGAGCLLLLLLGFLALLHMFNKALNQFTDTRPAPLPALQMSQPEIEEVQRKFDNFRDAAGSGRPVPPLVLTSDDVNALLLNSKEFGPARGKIYVKINDDHLQAQVSLPLKDIGLRFFKNRYLNGTATFKLSFANGMLTLNATEILVKGKPLPGVYMDKIRQENFAGPINNNSQTSIALNKLQAIELKDGKLILVPKQEK